MSEAGRLRRRKERQGCLLALLIFVGTIATVGLIFTAATAPSPFNGISGVVLGVGAILLGRPLAESGSVDLVIGAFGSSTSPNPPEAEEPSTQPHWYSLGRLIVEAFGLLLVIDGVVKIVGA